MSKSLHRVVQAADRRGLRIAPVRLGDGTRTAADAAAACGCGVAQIVKSVVLRCPSGPEHFLFLTSGANRVDLAKAGVLAGRPVGAGDAASIRAHTGFAIGGVSPLGHLTPIPVWMDPDLMAFATVWAAAGTPHHVFEIAPDPLRDATGATVADFSQSRSPSS